MLLLSLTAPLSDPDPRIRRWAAWTLGQRDAAARDVGPRLVSLLSDRDPLTLSYARRSLIDLGPTMTEALLPALERGGQERREAEAILVAWGSTDVVVPLANVVRTSRSATVRRSAYRVLGELGADAEEAVALLVEQLERRSQRAERVEIATALGKIGEASLPPLRRLLQETDDPALTEAVLRGLAAIGPAASPALPRVVESLAKGPTAGVRYNAALAIGALGEAGRPAVAALVARVRGDESATVRMYSALALGETGVTAKPVVRALVDVLREGDPQVAPRAAAALGKLGPGVADRLLDSLTDGPPSLRGWAAVALAGIEPAFDRTLPRIVARFDDEDETVRDRLMQALLKVGAPAVPALAEALANATSVDIRGHAALALGRLDERALPAVPTLAAALDDPEVRVRQLVSWTLGKLGPPAESAVDALSRSAADPDPTVRRNSVWALGNIGPAAVPHEGLLERIVADPGETDTVRTEADEALQKIRGTYDWED